MKTIFNINQSNFLIAASFSESSDQTRQTLGLYFEGAHAELSLAEPGAEEMVVTFIYNSLASILGR